MARQKMSTQQRVANSVERVECRMLELLAAAERWTVNSNLEQRRRDLGVLLDAARNYGHAIDRLSRVRK
jgi:hypothetical protein